MAFQSELERQLLKDFMKYELVDIANELGLEVSESSTAKFILRAIHEDLESHGVPEFSDVSQIFAEFLVAAEICDEDGNIIANEEEPESGASKPPAEEQKVSEEEKLPACYGFADDADPACKVCKVLTSCKEKRLNERPPCFGVSHDGTDDACVSCIEEPFCKIATSKLKQKKG